MNLYVGTTKAQSVYAGSTAAQAVYLGTTKVWPPAPYGPAEQAFNTLTPGTTYYGEANAHTLGVQLKFNIAGRIIAIGFYRTETGFNSRVLRLWDTSRIQVASVTSSETTGSSGWQYYPLTTPYMVNANDQLYVTYDALPGQAYSYDKDTNYPSDTTDISLIGGVYGVGIGVFPGNAPGYSYYSDVSFEPKTGA